MRDSVIPRWAGILVGLILVLVVIPICMVSFTLYVVLPDNTYITILSFAGIGVYVGASWGQFIHLTVKKIRKRIGEVAQ